MAGGARPLETDERRVLDLLLVEDFDGTPARREQARGASVMGHCDYGCPSVYLAPNADASPASGPRRVFHRGPVAALHGLSIGLRGALPQLVAAACQVGDLGGVARHLDGFAVRRARLLAAAQPAQQIGAGRVAGVIAGQLVLKTVDGRQCYLRSVKLGDRDGPVEGDDRRGVDADELVVEGDDLRPVGVA